jgi:hypothetical protein
MLPKGAAKVPGLVSLPLPFGGGGATKKSALGVGVIVTVAEADLLESVTEVAVTVTLFGLGTFEGAVNVVFVPLAVVVEPNEPQLPLGEQLQVTPPVEGSFVTAAATLVTAVTPIVPGGAG